MTKPSRELFDRALELPPAERERLARRLLESVDEEQREDELDLDPAFAKLLERRLADEPAEGEPWPTVDEVLARARRELKLPTRRSRSKRRRGA